MICLDRLKEITFLSRCPNEEKLLPDMLLTFYMSIDINVKRFLLRTRK